MKKFTKIILIITGILAALGIIFCGIAAVMGAGWSTIHRKALAGELDFGNWHIGNGVYYANDQGHGSWDHFWDDDYDDDDDWNDEDDDDWDEDDDDDLDDEIMDDNRAVESFGSWILNLTDFKSEPAGTESCMIPYPASEAASLKLELDVVNELIFEVSDSADEISIKMENGYQDYLSTKQKDSDLKVSYHSGHHHFEKGPTFTVVLPRQCENLTLDIVVGVGDVSMESEAFTARKVNVSVGVGELSVNQISASEKAVFEVGTGDVSILNGQFQKVSIEAGVGDAVFSGSVSNKLEVEAGTGDVNVSLTGTEKSYAYDLSAGLGEIRLNGRSKGAFDAEYETGSNGGAEVELTAGVGDISVLTQQ